MVVCSCDTPYTGHPHCNSLAPTCNSLAPTCISLAPTCISLAPTCISLAPMSRISRRVCVRRASFHMCGVGAGRPLFLTGFSRAHAGFQGGNHGHSRQAGRGLRASQGQFWVSFSSVWGQILVCCGGVHISNAATIIVHHPLLACITSHTLRTCLVCF
jgi:hypothetical protein